MLALAFLAGSSTLLAAFLAYRLWLAALPRSVCPECGDATLGVSHALSARTDRWVRRRWCPGCGWAGWGRNGPVHWRDMDPISHESGFRWGPERIRPDFGFEWNRLQSSDAGPPTPAHPSGFRWGVDPSGVADGDMTTSTSTPAHPSGFRFRDISPAAAPHRSTPFRWKA